MLRITGPTTPSLALFSVLLQQAKITDDCIAIAHIHWARTRARLSVKRWFVLRLIFTKTLQDV